MAANLSGRAAVTAVTAYVVLAAAGLSALLLTGTDKAAVIVLAVAATAGLVAFLTRLLGRTRKAVRRMAGDIAVIADANVSHRLSTSGSGELAPLVAAVNRLADARESVEAGAVERAGAARRDVESERNRLAALMAQLTVAVVVCNREGRILLYNEAARWLVGDATLVGLGRSVFGVVDRGLVAHAYDHLVAGAESVYTATTLHRDRQIRVHVTLVREPAPGAVQPGSGFVLVLDDLTRQVRASDQRERLLRLLTEGTRGSLGSIRAAAESVLEFPDMTPEERRQFLEIISQEADRLGRRVEDLVSESAHLADDRGLTEIAGDDLLRIVRNELERSGLDCDEGAAPTGMWLRADGHAVARAVVHLVTRLKESVGAGHLHLTLTPAGPHGQLDARWRGRAPVASVVDAWLEEPLGASGTATAREVADRHRAEIWCGDLDSDMAYLRLLLPLTAGTRPDTVAGPSLEVTSRPEFYDFDLFTARAQPGALADQRLDEMTFTVFDTETTGLDPAGGDRIVSIGAVRVVNGRVLRQETFERLVQPERSVPAVSTAIHGITADMLDGQPTIAEVLPDFSRFAEDTVLVGHNVGFDLQFLRRAQPSARVALRPALDTLLLHAALYPDHEDHTLEAIASRLGVSVVGRHTALGDALVTAEVFVGLVALLRRRGIHTFGAALSAARTTFQARADEQASVVAGKSDDAKLS